MPAKNYIGLNIKYLCENNFLSQDDFGAKFDLKKSVVGTYVRGISCPKIEVMQKICQEYEILLDEFVNTDLYLKNKGYTTTHKDKTIAESGVQDYTTEREALFKTIAAQEKTIAALQLTIDTLLKK
jgi:HTH-type transcriptional regulator/antitoxin PezA